MIQFHDFKEEWELGREELSADQKQQGALKVVNDWRAKHPEVRILSIETLVKQTGSSMVAVERREFLGFRVWFEN